MQAVNDNVLEIHNLKTYFYGEEGEVPAVDGVTLAVKRGTTVAVVGESGCGKSVTAYSILKLIQQPGKIIGGTIKLFTKQGETVDITSLAETAEKLFEVRGGLVSMIFQEPMTALSPVHTIGNQLTEAILIHQKVTLQEAEAFAIEMLGKVGIPGPEQRLQQYPHELSGGMRQRVVIAMALMCKPELLIADEPTTALDVTIQAQILQLIKDLQQDMDTSVILITHDLGVVAQMADEIAVMYLGKIVEQADVRSILKHPRHPYTQGLLKSLPSMNTEHTRLPSIKGSVPSLTRLPTGCTFHPRCPHAKPGLCDTGEVPALRELSPGHMVGCTRAEEL